MTNEMKENILKYLTGNIGNASYDPDLIYSNVKTITSNLDIQLTALFPHGYDATQIVQGRTIKGNTLNYSVLYGNYTNDNNKTRGYIAIIDEYGSLIQVITEFTSGVKIGQIYTLNVDEEGYFYMIEHGVESDKKRFVMMNNVVIKGSNDTEYVVKIRKAYAIPDTCLMYDGNIVNIVKAVGQAKYMIFGWKNQGQFHYMIPIGTELTINVGSENEWKDYDGVVYNDGTDSYSVNPIATYATWNQDTITFIILTQAFIQDEIRLVKYTKNGTTMTYTQIPVDTTGYTSLWGENALILNDTKGYFAFSHKSAGASEIHSLLELDLTNNISNEIYYEGGYTYDTDNSSLARFTLNKLDNEVFFVGFRETGIDDVTHKYIWTISVGRIRLDDYYANQVSSYDLTTYEPDNQFHMLFVNKQFNFYNFNVLLDNTTYNCYQIYNANNYNGIAVETYKSLLPNSGILYDENNNVIFARNLYNKVISGSTTTSTLEVPNQFINDITIAKQDLLSFNNNILVDNSQNVITNQYETLDINFINEIKMVNRNDTNNPINNETGSMELNNSFSLNLDYQNKLANYIKINYSDNTSYEFSLSQNQIVLSNNVVTYSFTAFNPVNKDISTIDILSNDKTTVYQTIDASLLNLQRGRYYNITQDVYVV